MWKPGATLQKKDQLEVISNLATMLTAGIPIFDAVDSLREESKGALRKVLNVLHDSLAEGHPLSHGMEKLPRIFDPVTVNLIKAAEESGTLEQTLKDLTVSIKKEQAFNDQLKSSLTYPTFVFVIFVAVLAFILCFVVPRLGRVFSGMADLPPATEFLLSASQFLRGNFIAIILVTVVVIVGISVFYQARRREVLSALLSLPGLRKLGQEIDLANFSRSMGMLLSAGIPVAEALNFSAAVVSKKEVRRMIERMSRDVDAGHSLARGMRASKGVAPAMMVRITETAEASGALESSMKDLSDYFETQVSRRLRKAATLLEPVMLVVMGLLVGGMMLAVIAPIYNLIGQLSGR
jgi:type IV pilus assembly protein PilC